jgi:hypothetical protein
MEVSDADRELFEDIKAWLKDGHHEGVCPGMIAEFRQKAISTQAAELDALRGEVRTEDNTDVVIGDFIAQYDEAAGGVMMDADTAQLLAREFKRMRGLIYCPGVLRCAKCEFRLVKVSLCVTDGNAYADESPDTCPNCDVPMWKITWKDEAEYIDKVAESQLNRALEAEATIAQLRDRVVALEEIPSHIAEQVLSMGRAEWGATSEKTSTEHLADLENTLRLTREKFNLEDIPVQMHGLYLEGAETVLCHTGTSPNSGANAQALVGAWNWLYDQSKARALLTQNEVG